MRRVRSTLVLPLIATLLSCQSSSPDDQPLESLDLQTLQWVAPLQSDTIATDDIVSLVVATESPEATAVHFEVDGQEVGACDPANDPAESPALNPMPAPAPVDTFEPIDDTDLVATPTDQRSPGVYGAVDSEPADSAQTDTETTPDDDDDPVADAEVPVGVCHSGNQWRWETTLATTGRHTLSAYFVRANGTRATVTRTIEVVTPGEVPADPPGVIDDSADPVPADQLTDTDTDIAVDAIVPTGQLWVDPNTGHHRSVFGGAWWQVTQSRVVTARGVHQTAVATVQRCWNRFGANFTRYAQNQDVSLATMVALSIAESNCSARYGGGPMRVPASACHTLDPNNPNCAARLRDTPDYAIQLGVARLASNTMRRRSRHDPVLEAVLYRAGALRRSNAAPWHVAIPKLTHSEGGNYVDNFIGAYNAFRTFQRYHYPSVSYRNPVIGTRNTSGVYTGSLADPGIIRVGNDYYVAGTGGRMAIMHSTNMRDWQSAGAVFPAGSTACNYGPGRATDQPPWMTSWATSWAPEIHRVGNRYAVVYAACCAGTCGAGGTARICVGIAFSDNPAGPYCDRGSPIVDSSRGDSGDPSFRGGVIDPNLFVDDAPGGTGHTYLYWKTDDNGSPGAGRPTRIFGRQLTDDASAFAPGSAPHLLLTSNQHWEGNTPGGWQGIAEAPWVFRHDYNGQRRYYMLFSGNLYTYPGDCGALFKADQDALAAGRSPTPMPARCSHSPYSEGAAWSDGPLGHFSDHVHAGPILQRNGDWEGPGHGGVVSDPSGNLFFFYAAWVHGHVAGWPGTVIGTRNGQRVLLGNDRVDLAERISWTADGWPSISNGSPARRSAWLVGPTTP